MGNIQKLNILFCGARKLGIQCLDILMRTKYVNIVGVVVPRADDKKWWTDINEVREVRRRKKPLVLWNDAKEFKNLDLVVSVLHGQIFTDLFISRVKFGIINLHPAPLPEYRGKNGPAHAIINNERKFGATLHYVDVGIDTGPIIKKMLFNIGKLDTGFSVYQKTHQIAVKLFREEILKVIRDALNGKRILSTPQDKTKAQYYSCHSIDNKEVDLNWEYEKIYNYVRALQFTPFEPAFFIYKNQKIHLQTINKKIIILNQYPLIKWIQ